MKTLYMVRHAKSSWENLQLSDHDRPLNSRGKQNAPEMGRRLKLKGILPDLLISSSAKRARNTAKKISKKIGYSISNIETTSDLYHADENSIIELVRNQDDSLDTIMIFGHNPGFTDCLNLLAGAGIYNIPTCGVAGIGFDFKSWKEVATGGGSIILYDYPKKDNSD